MLSGRESPVLFSAEVCSTGFPPVAPDRGVSDSGTVEGVAFSSLYGG
ncbi:hypothetical protein A2U01_0089246, partial [Trifolium medium]|nr:hypothetical protein [Trifolium medium]